MRHTPWVKKLFLVCQAACSLSWEQTHTHNDYLSWQLSRCKQKICHTATENDRVAVVVWQLLRPATILLVPSLNAPHCISKRRTILTHISRALVSPGASPEEVKLLQEFGCHPRVTASTQLDQLHPHTNISLLPEGRQLTAGLRQRARKKGIRSRRRLYLQWKGTALLVSIALFSWCSGEHIFAQLIMWCYLFHIFFIAKQKEIEFINIMNNMRYVRYWLSC